MDFHRGFANAVNQFSGKAVNLPGNFRFKIGCLIRMYDVFLG
jgi:hypothetical protein